MKLDVAATERDAQTNVAFTASSFPFSLPVGDTLRVSDSLGHSPLASFNRTSFVNSSRKVVLFRHTQQSLLNDATLIQPTFRTKARRYAMWLLEITLR